MTRSPRPAPARFLRAAAAVGAVLLAGSRAARSAGSSRRVLARTGWDPAAIDWFVPHQANIRIINAVAQTLGIPADRVATNLEHVGNTVAASIPRDLADAHDPRRPALERGCAQGR